MYNLMPAILADKLSGHSYSGTDVTAVVVTGIVVVFCALILLILLVSIYGAIFKKISDSKKAKAEAEAQKQIDNAPKTGIKATPSPAVEDGIEEEVVAVIMAAISAMSAESGKKLVLKSVKKSSPQRNAWASAGLVDNTRPF